MKQIRNAQGCTQQALAGQIGMLVSTIRRIESGSTMLSVGTLIEIGQVLSLPLSSESRQNIEILFPHSNKL
ncbi:helix-turn-helix domain-containing protein [Marinococcus halophilus]|uniref:helix-turn-helix domain-containing protein n=1 Tax=Marinococcus halophilus TaxID=1371 RepID=UPI00360D1C50